MSTTEATGQRGVSGGHGQVDEMEAVTQEVLHKDTSRQDQEQVHLEAAQAK